jgi:uncharacterized protein (TIGR04141 family)
MVLVRKGNSMQTAIYYIDRVYLEEFKNWDDFIKDTIGKEKGEYKEQAIDNIKFNKGYNTKLFISNPKEYMVKKLVDFYSPIVTDKMAVNKIKKRDISTILFIYNDNEMYAVPTGYGYFMIQDYLDMNFGMKLLSGLVNRNENAIKNITERGISGMIMGSTRYYRLNYSFSNEDDFGKLFKEVCAIVPAGIIKDKLGFSDDEVKKDLTCIAKTSFKINKSIDIEKLYELIFNISKLLDSCEGLFNNLIPIMNKGNNRKLNNELNNELIKIIYENYKNNNYKIEFDIFHTEFDKFLKAKDYNIFYNKKMCFETNINSIDDFSFLKNIVEKFDVTADNSLDDFSILIKSIIIYSYNDIGKEQTKAALLKHIQGEIKYNNKTYFIIDGNWFMVEDKFINNINQHCQNQVCRCKRESLIDLQWITGDEGYFINSVINNCDNFIQIHPEKVEFIEICDLIKVESDRVSLIHIKDRFDYKMRDLTSQIFLAARRLQEMRNSNDYKFLEELYPKIINKNKTKFPSLSKDQFIDFFKNNVEFVLAFRDHRNSSPSIFDDVSQSESNIAKYSVTNFIKEMENSFNFGISVFEIKK